MCTLVVLRRPAHPWPLLLAANRDEMRDRPWLGPGRHWPERPHTLAGLDRLAGGSWLGMNDHGVVAGMLNRRGTLGPIAGKRSRGLLVLDALDHRDAAAAADALLRLDPRAYRPFNMAIADIRDAFWLRNDGARMSLRPIEDGVSMLTAYDINDVEDPRIDRFLPLFRATPAPDPGSGNWRAWQALLAMPAPRGVAQREAGLTFELENGFGTRSSMLIALPSPESGAAPVCLFAAGPPDRAAYEAVAP